MTILANYHLTIYALKVLSLVLGCGVLAVGICLEVIADVTMLSGEFTVQVAARRYNKEFSKVKVIFDCTLVALAIISSLLFRGKVVGIREGTIIAALITGPFVKLLGRYAKPITNWFAAAADTNVVIAEAKTNKSFKFLKDR